ncbi:MAG: hypothetical protein R3B36_10225 [Polyangiaceae bacterium]
MRTMTLTGLFCLVVSTACATQPIDRSVEVEAQRSAASVASLEGTWAFALETSDVAKSIIDKCVAESAGDDARAKACFDEVRDESRAEQVRFSRAADGKTTWRSFGKHGASEELYLEAPVELTSAGGNAIDARVAGEAAGSMAKAHALPVGTTLRFELVDSSTIALLDPKKGRLVYHRAH